MKISKNRIKVLIKEAIENINERMSQDIGDFNIDNINIEPPDVGAPPPPKPPSRRGGGGGGGGNGDFIFLMVLSRKMFDEKGFGGGMFKERITSFDQLLEFDRNNLPSHLHLVKTVKSLDGEDIELSFIADFQSLEASLLVSCFDEEKDFTDVIDGFERKITSNFGYISFLITTDLVIKMCQETSIADIVSAGSNLLDNFKGQS